jgi:hypothetical protein
MEENPQLTIERVPPDRERWQRRGVGERVVIGEDTYVPRSGAWKRYLGAEPLPRYSELASILAECRQHMSGTETIVDFVARPRADRAFSGRARLQPDGRPRQLDLLLPVRAGLATVDRRLFEHQDLRIDPPQAVVEGPTAPLDCPPEGDATNVVEGRFQGMEGQAFVAVVPDGYVGCRNPVSGVRVELRRRGERRPRGFMQATQVGRFPYTSLDDFVALQRSTYDEYAHRDAAWEWTVEEATVAGLTGKRVRFVFRPDAAGPRILCDVWAGAREQQFYQLWLQAPLSSAREDGGVFDAFVASFSPRG